MKRLTKAASTVLAVSLLVTTSIPAFAASKTEAAATGSTAISKEYSDETSMRGNINRDSNKTPELTEEQKTEMTAKMTERLTQQLEDGNIPTLFGRGDAGMEKAELTEEQKAEMTARMTEKLAQQLEDGKITQEQYDQAMADIADGNMPTLFGRGHGDMEKAELTEEQKAEMTARMTEKLAQQLEDGKITQEQYDQAMADIVDGNMQTLFGRGHDDMEKAELTEEQEAEMTARMIERLTQQLEDGKITQEQYNQAMADIADGNMPILFGRGHGDMEKAELTEEQKAEMIARMTEKLAQQLEDGKITQEQYDQAMADIADGNMPTLFGRGYGGMEKQNLTNEQ